MKQKQLTTTFIKISNWKKTFDLHDFIKIIISALLGLIIILHVLESSF